MENIYIKINKKTRQVNLSKSVIGNDGENLQSNLIFTFDEFVDGTARLEIVKYNSTPTYVMLTKVDESYQLPIKSIMTKAGRVDMQLVITEGTDNEEIPIFKSNEFYVIVNTSINAEIEEPDEYPEWIEIANTKLNELDNLDIDVEKVNHTTTITITKKDETQEIINIYDGEKGEQGEQGIQGIPGKDGVDGKDGKDGTNGNNGQDGFSPVATITQTTTGATISITDKNGTTTANITNGTTPDISGKLDTSKVKSTYSTTSGDVYDVSYINTMIGNIETLLSEV